MADQSSNGAPGLVAALKASAVDLLEMLKTRLELLFNEVQIQRELVLRQLWLTLALVVCLSFSMLLLVALTLLLWWEQRLLVVGFFGLLFSTLSVLIFVSLKRGTIADAPVFAQSLAALQDDLRQLKQAAGHEPSPR